MPPERPQSSRLWRNVRRALCARHRGPEPRPLANSRAGCSRFGTKLRPRDARTLPNGSRHRCISQCALFPNGSNLRHIMRDWIFKKNKAPVGDRPEGTAPEPKAGGRPVQVQAATASAIAWQLKLQAALGDDTALLALAREGAPVDVKVAAVSALTSEAALKLAEREHRDHDRRVHRLAKQRHLAQVARRETAEQASRLIEAAKALIEEPLIPANRLVELDRAWRALDLTLLDAAQRAEFEALVAQLSLI